MASRGWNMRSNTVNPLERIERDRRGAGARVRRCFHGQAAILPFLQCVHRYLGQGGAGDIAGLRLERGQGGGLDGRSGEDGEARMDPGKKIVHECLRETFGLVQALEPQSSEHLHDSHGIKGRKR